MLSRLRRSEPHPSRAPLDMERTYVLYFDQAAHRRTGTRARAPGTPICRWSRTGWRCLTWAVHQCQPPGSPPSPRARARIHLPWMIAPENVDATQKTLRPARAQPRPSPAAVRPVPANLATTRSHSRAYLPFRPHVRPTSRPCILSGGPAYAGSLSGRRQDLIRRAGIERGCRSGLELSDVGDPTIIRRTPW